MRSAVSPIARPFCRSPLLYSATAKANKGSAACFSIVTADCHCWIAPATSPCSYLIKPMLLIAGQNFLSWETA